jgi:hypothetical protein
VSKDAIQALDSLTRRQGMQTPEQYALHELETVKDEIGALHARIKNLTNVND